MSVVLRGITWDHPRGLDCLRASAAQYPGVTVEWSARSLQAFADAPLEQLVRDYDLLIIDHPHVPHAQRQSLLSPLDGVGHDAELAVLAAQSVGRSHQSYELAGHQYGLAVDAAAQVAVYRPDLLSEPPRTWAQVWELADAGKVLWPAKPVDAISSFLSVAANSGVDVGGADFVDSAAGAEVLRKLHRLADRVPAECLEYNPIQVAERLSSQDDWVYAPLAFGYTNYSRPGFRRHRLAYTTVPGISGACLGGAGIAVSARTAHPEEAVAHAFWLAAAQTQRGVYYRAGGQPGNAIAWDDDETNADSLDFFRNTRATLEAARVRPHYDGWLDVQDAAGTAINRALRGDIDDGTCLRLIARHYRQSREQHAGR
jgi:multiple sugar transport system substrate-binding protein